ncbi:MAG: DNA cytosine methyltransferase [Acidobacteriota bacterium]|nr:DNA cytosine methyltransferase [Acidobacteriota bacterium]
MDHDRIYKVIDLFSGAGGMSAGFSRKMGQPFESVWANDFNADAALTYNANFDGHCLHGDIVNLLDDSAVHIPKADVVIGGPPCQGFSLLNKNRLDDVRKQLWRPYLEVVRRSDASIFVMENVPQLLGSREFEEIQAAAEDLGFQLAFDHLLAADYGVPQRRKRAFVIGCRFADPADVFPPRRTHYNPGDKRVSDGSIFDDGDYVACPVPWLTVRDAVADLKPPRGTELRKVSPPYNLHFGRSPTRLSMERYRTIPKEGMNRFDLQERAPHLTPKCWIKKKSGGTDLFGRLWWDRPAFTIRTEFFKPEKGRYLHPEQHRPITHREAARFQSFPDDFIFKGTKMEIARQIGNAVPPLLAARLADCVRILFDAAREFNLETLTAAQPA